MKCTAKLQSQELPSHLRAEPFGAFRQEASAPLYIYIYSNSRSTAKGRQLLVFRGQQNGPMISEKAGGEQSVGLFPKHASGMRGSDIQMIENRSTRSLLPPLGQSCLRQPSRKFGTYLSKPVVSSRRDAKFCVSSRRDAIFWAWPEFPRKMRARNILGHFLIDLEQ